MRYVCSLPNEKKAGRIPQLFSDDPAAIKAFVKKWDQPGRGVFYCVGILKPGATRRCREELAAIEGLHFDIDYKDISEPPEEIERRLRRLPLPTTLRRSGGGVHVLVLLKEPATDGPEIGRTEAALKRLTAYLCADPAPAHPVALLRYPGTRNTKRGKPILVEQVWGGRACDITEVENFLDRVEGAELFTRHAQGNGGDHHSPFEPPAEKTPVDVAERLAAMRFKGRGDSAVHTTQLACTASLLRSGCTVDHVVAEVLEATRKAVAGDARTAKWSWATEELEVRRMCTDFISNLHPELSVLLPDELRAKFEAAIAAGKTPKVVYARHIGWHVRSFEGCEQSKASEDGDSEPAPKPQAASGKGWSYFDSTTPARPRWLVKAILPETGIGTLSGQWGSYKTTVALDLSVSVMTGLPFAGQYRVKRKGAVLYFAMEGAGTLQTRLAAIAKARGAAHQFPFAWRGDCPMLTDKRAAEIMIGYVAEAAAHFEQTYDLPVALLWVDTMITAAGFAPKEENDAAATQKALTTLHKVASQTGALVMAVDHLGKAPEAGTRGSSNKEASVDTVLATLADREPSGEVANSRLAARKQRDGISGFETPFAPQTIELGTDEDGDPVSAVVLTWGEKQRPKPTAPLSTAAQLLLRVLKAILSAKGIPLVPAPGAGVVQAIPVADLRKEFYSQYTPDEGSKSPADRRRVAFKRAMEALQLRPFIMVRDIDGCQWVWKIGEV
jgi:AAA domain